MKRLIAAPIRLFVILVILQTGSCSKDDVSDGPAITNVTPLSGGSGRRITIESNDAFVGEPADQIVTFASSYAQVISVTKSSMTVRVPDNAGNGRIRIVSGGNKIEGPVFEYIPPVPTEYFVRFKENGTFVDGLVITDAAPTENCVISDAGPCREIIFFVQGHAKEAYIELHLDEDNTIETLESFYGVPIAIRPRTMPPAVTFGVNISTGNLISDDAEQTGTTGSFRITSLRYHNSFVSDYDVYDAEGTFECVIYDRYNNNKSVITEGTFRMPIAAMVIE
ncbi:MAG: IPT/TIG domain-containing protein [Bacteroidota bacterium]